MLKNRCRSTAGWANIYDSYSFEKPLADLTFVPDAL